MYFLKGGIVVGIATTISNTNGEVTLDNIRLLEHANDNNLFKSDKNYKFEICEPCALDWQNRVKFVIVVHHTKGMLHYVHTDV